MSKKNETRDELGARMKEYEKIETAKTLDSRLPIYARLDGRGFSKFTKNFDRPFDRAFSDNMVDTTKFLIERTNATIGYTQSDEISLVWRPLLEETSSFLFDGKIQKLTSVLASMATAKFSVALTEESRLKFPHFDCRIINLPNKSEAANMVAWREIDCRKNAISMLARCHFSHKELHKKSGKQMLEMLAEKNVYLKDIGPIFANGAFVRRGYITRMLPHDIMLQIPENYRPDTEITRSMLETINVAPYSKLQNKVEVMFENQEPIR